jgi:hypothetical protein
MWLFIKSLFMVKDRSIAKEMVAAHGTDREQPRFKVHRLLRRKARRNRFKAHNTTHLKSKVK